MLDQQPTTAEEVARALDAVYARPEFAPVSASPLYRWLNDLLTRIGDFLADLFRLAGADARLAGRVVIGVLSVFGLILAYHLVRTAYGVWRARERGRVRPTPDASSLSGAADANAWLARAGAEAAAGRWRQAVLALYPALVLRLDAAGHLSFDPSKTPGDYRRETRRAPMAARLLDAFLARFEPVAFGGREADAALFEALRATATAATSSETPVHGASSRD